MRYLLTVLFLCSLVSCCPKREAITFYDNVDYNSDVCEQNVYALSNALGIEDKKIQYKLELGIEEYQFNGECN